MWDCSTQELRLTPDSSLARILEPIVNLYRAVLREEVVALGGIPPAAGCTFVASPQQNREQNGHDQDDETGSGGKNPPR